VPGGTFLGVAAPDGEYEEGTSALQSGFQFLTFTDGVTEAGRGHGQLFQNGQLPAFLAGLPAGLSAGQVVMRLLQALQVHAAAPWPEDDTTVLGLRRC
jgi:serine phosphatase RsbU (regulator of sigma subunit)